MVLSLSPNPSGVCLCGCGESAPIATITNRSRGIRQGEAHRFIRGHSHRKKVRWIEEDRGHDSPCWIWQLALLGGGYGQVHVREDGKKRILMAHRFYYEKAYGEIPAGIVIDHKCRTRSCVRPDHLQAVTTTENARLVRARMKPLVSRERVKEVLISELRAAGVPAPEEVARRVVEGLFLGTEAWGEC